MQYSSWQLDIALILLLSCGKLVIIACKLTMKLPSSESMTPPTVVGGKKDMIVYECFDSEHVNV